VDRHAIRVTGVVQGVGFRPFAFRLARQRALAGFVRNELGSVRIEVEGPEPALADFARELTRSAPSQARVDGVSVSVMPPRGEVGFRIAPSAETDEAELSIPPDLGPCEDCVRELQDPEDRRYRYPLVNCSHCGPRLTVILGLPYDRSRTTLAPFEMCEACRAEYEDPGQRRFHAEPSACPRCGPAMKLEGGQAWQGEPVQGAVAALLSGCIVSVKSAGGFHLACDATNEDAVSTLRRRKGRKDKPFALLVADVDAAKALCHVPAHAAAILVSGFRPIVLLEARLGGWVAPSVAPGSRLLGLVLPPTPVHHLLAHGVARPLVMTSGNVSDEPIAYEDEDARRRLTPLADVMLTHDRPIHMRCDDSVVRPLSSGVIPLRRSRGFAPARVGLPHALARPTLAVGGMLKATFALGCRSQTVVSHHLGDLGNAEAYRSFQEAVAHYEALYRIRPERLVHDLHPDYPTTAWALARAEDEGLETIAVQHHHAHFASALLDAKFPSPAIGVVYDGSGYGGDGTLWGGEILVGDAAGVERVGHLLGCPLPGGDRAAREPWRVAVARLHAAELPLNLAEQRIGVDRVAALLQVMERETFAPVTSSVGRLFDALAWLLGGPDCQTFEGQAAMALEGLASSASASGAYAFALAERGGRLALDPNPMLREVVEDLARGVDAPRIARRFHQALADVTAEACAHVAAASGLRDIVLTGGVFQNALLTELLSQALADRALRVHLHRDVPPNDGGLALGQLAVIAAREASH
jgi:hydrogenase maturation protein HypF